MQRYFVQPGQMNEGIVTLVGDDAHHAVRVMRMNVGDRFFCSDGAGREVLAEIVETGKSEVTAKVMEELPLTAEPAIQVWVAQSLPKGDKLETVIQKCTEIGAARFIPFLSERTVVHYDDKKEAKRLERWRKISKEAAEQAHRNRIPAVDSPCRWELMLEQAKLADLALICYEKEHTRQLRDVLSERLKQREGAHPLIVLLIVGPEGGLTEREVEQAEAAGCMAVGLGRRILRTETAAMVGLTCILYESGEMGGTATCRQ